MIYIKVDVRCDHPGCTMVGEGRLVTEVDAAGNVLVEDVQLDGEFTHVNGLVRCKEHIHSTKERGVGQWPIESQT